ncbi:LysR family transcriptional regulator [Glycomyces paridis]|uniref:LysR family transcriptional regulator n=1 Tax=Glycomyces paridis TaxID=2126555 RepID=A0A4S8P587_9ACTN|nr:LysR family transcriptional regulator [Glycomyces paridis]THV22879.1 LysR family transcriptional regulator [Glycomyces paridis]
MHDHQGVELRHLRYFVAVAEEGTMTEAARVLRIAQPSLSQQISTLERRVGAPLFRRRPKGMELTEGGRILYASATRALAEIESSLVQARDARRLVRVGVCRSVPEHLLTRVERILTRDGSLDVSFEEDDSQRHLDRLRTGALAFAVIRVFHPSDDLAEMTLADEPQGVVLHPNHPLVERAALSWTDLADQELLWFPSKANARFAEETLAHLAGHGWTPQLRIVDAHSQALYCHHLRSSENLVGLRGQGSIAADAGMAWRPLASHPPRRRFILATPRTSPWAKTGLLTRRQPDRG